MILPFSKRSITKPDGKSGRKLDNYACVACKMSNISGQVVTRNMFNDWLASEVSIVCDLI